MRNITFIVDSGCDYEPHLAAYFKYPVRVVPLHVNINGKEYLDGENITKIEFYQQMEQMKQLPKTSQPAPNNFFAVFKEELDKGNKVLFIGISSKLSGTFQSANIARSMFTEQEQNDIYLVDSLNLSATIIFLLIKANSLLQSGHTLEEVKTHLESFRAKINFLALLDTLENLKMGGRISSAQAAIGGLLNIKPLITIENGLIKTLDKFRGRTKGINFLSNKLNSLHNISKNKLIVVHNILNEEKLMEELKHIDLSKFKDIIYLKLGAAIGTHAGIGTIGLAFEESV